MIRFACPGCATAFTVTDDRAGKSSKCPNCQSKFVIPGTAATPSVVDPPPPSPPAPSPSKYATSTPPVSLRPCPACGVRMSVLPTDVGLDIRCTGCGVVFKAERDDAPPPLPRPTTYPVPMQLPAPAYPPPPPLRRRDDSDDDEEDDRPRKRKRRKAEYEEEDDEPIRRRSRVSHIVRIGVLKFALTSAMVFFVLALATMLLYGLFLLLSFTCLAAMVNGGSSGYSSSSYGNSNPTGGLLVLGGAGAVGWLIQTIIVTVCGFIGGFIYGLIFALAYNAAAKMTGGIEVELK